MNINAYPLFWPDGWKRTTPGARDDGRFGKRAQPRGNSYAPLLNLTVADGIKRVMAELEHLQVRRDDLVISTNMPTRLDGFPRSDAANPQDPGVTVWWRTRKGQPRCMACDRYTRVADNLAAIAASLEAMRAISRHGSAEILDRAYTGFTALPAPEVIILGSTVRPWRDVLGMTSWERSLQVVEDAYRRLASQCHPDKNIDDSEAAHARMAELNAARDAARKELQA